MAVDWKKHARVIIARLGEDLTWTPQGGLATTVHGVYVEPYRQQQVGEISIGGSAPSFVAIEDDLPAVARGDSIARGTATYRVLEAQRDQPPGVITLTLERMS